MPLPGSRNIVITGFMGTGKSTVGKLVAESLSRRFIDMDKVLEENEGATINEIFNNNGEAHFRQCELHLVHKLSREHSLVIATGGGTLTQWNNYELFYSNKALIICLTTSLSEILKRLSGDILRPVLSAKIDDKTALMKLFKTREAIYTKVPYQIDTTGKTAMEVASSLLHLYSDVVSVHT